MKHNLKVTLVILAMFVVTQFIGLYVVNHYFSQSLPYGLDQPSVETQTEFNQILVSIILAFVIAVFIFFLLAKYKIEFLLRVWFFLVVSMALGISLNTFIPNLGLLTSSIISFIIALPFAYLKIYKQNILVHNFTELLIYPGIAAVFVPILNVYTVIGLLLLISVYDAWAVWHSGIMQKMAKYQMNNLKVFSGFFVPYASKRVKAKIAKLKKLPEKERMKHSVKVNIALLGGGDVVFPIITAGVMLKAFGIIPAILVIVGATAGLSYLLFFAEKKKFYPAMPFITAGIIVGMAVGYLVV